MSDLKSMIIKDLGLNVVPTAKRCGVTSGEFIRVLDELQSEGKIWYSKIEDKTSPFYGEPKHIRLIKK